MKHNQLRVGTAALYGHNDVSTHGTHSFSWGGGTSKAIGLLGTEVGRHCYHSINAEKPLFSICLQLAVELKTSITNYRHPLLIMFCGILNWLPGRSLVVALKVRSYQSFETQSPKTHFKFCGFWNFAGTGSPLVYLYFSCPHTCIFIDWELL